MKPKFNIGDEVFVITYGGVERNVPCPVCFGKKKIGIILGNDDIVEVPCNYCEVGYEGSRGYIIETDYFPKVRAKTISGIEYSSKEIRYKTSDYYVFDESKVFPTEEEAKRGCEEDNLRREKENPKKNLNLKEKSNKSYSWHVGYHKREEKRAREEAERHAKKVISMGKLAEKDKRK